jgi:hypothetical protein
MAGEQLARHKLGAPRVAAGELRHRIPVKLFSIHSVRSPRPAQAGQRNGSEQQIYENDGSVTLL